MKLMDDCEKVGLLVDIFMRHNLRKTERSVNLHKFVKDVQETFRNKGHIFSEKEILITWKDLLEEYYYYKENFSNDDAKKAWNLFDLMDNCFDNKNTEKFTPHLTFFLIDCMSNYKKTLSSDGLTEEVLQLVEREFKQLGNNQINQKDIFTQWEVLKQSYRESRLLMKQRCRNQKFNEYYEAMRVFYQSPEFYVQKQYHSPLKRRIANEEPSENSSKKVNETKSFNSTMRFKLLTCIKTKRNELGFNKDLSSSLLSYIIEEFKTLDCHLSTEVICNEWNDLYYRYELLKSSENPYHWKYFNDVKSICDSTESVVVESIETNPVSGVDENLLDKYSKKFAEMPELKDLMLDNNLSGEEVNYLLNLNES